MEYRFDTFPNPPVAYSPVTTPVNASGGLNRGTGVKCSDGRVLHVWVERWTGSGEGRSRIYQGYASDVDTYLTSDGSVYSGTESVTLLAGCTDLSVFQNSYVIEAFVSVAPDGSFYLTCQMWGTHGDYTWDVLEDPTAASFTASRTMMWRSTDDGATWDFRCTLPTNTSAGRWTVSGMFPIAGRIEVLPTADTNGGAWIIAAPDQVSGGSGTAYPAQAFFMSTDNGASWTREYDKSGGAWKGQAGSGFAVGRDGRIYNKFTFSAKSTSTTAYWTRSAVNDFAGTWNDYDTDTAGGDATDQRPGPWFTLYDDSTNIYTIQPPVAASVSSSLLTIYSVDLVTNPTPDLPGDYTEYVEFDVTNLESLQDVPILMPLDANWAGVWVGLQVVGLPLIGCPTTTLLHIPNKTWWEEDDAETRGRMVRSNLNKIRSWADLVTREGATDDLLLFDQAWPAELVGGNRAVFEHMWLSIERWSRSVCWDDGVHVPYKHDPSMDYWNLLAFERWANRYS